MTDVFCDRSSCIYCQNGLCCKEIIKISEFKLCISDADEEEEEEEGD